MERVVADVFIDDSNRDTPEMGLWGSRLWYSLRLPGLLPPQILFLNSTPLRSNHLLILHTSASTTA